MKQRRNLVEGLNETPDVELLEKEFVFGGKDSATSENKPETATASSSTPDKDVMPQFKGRVPLTTRCRPELASALKRASLQRQLSGVEPNRMQDILEAALEDWLSSHGYAR
ncbi:hypothetical protein [Roseiconus lacunae]|uniref:hypothetical protein n=1 Tax=Roseiconus lacunae TaxID=2605694 RepID=UPI001E30A850|nr:hypothetical protein [Roseiconus lacunae]MCD0462083.1 hypothetical protein [Roseiconus lacunae]